MSDLRVVPLDYKMQDGQLVPCDSLLYEAVRVYCSVNLAEMPDFNALRRFWAAVEYDGDNIVEVHGVTATVQRQDIPLFRVTGDHAKRATKMLYDRLNGFFADNGMLGHEVFLYINGKETEEQRCPLYEESLRDVGATPAHRYSVRIK